MKKSPDFKLRRSGTCCMLKADQAGLKKITIGEKRNAVVFDFLADTSKKQGRSCVILDLPVSVLEGQKISAFFCEQMCKASDATFCSGMDHGVFRVILAGAEEQVSAIMEAYWKAF